MFGTLSALREKAIPLCSDIGSRLQGFYEVPIDHQGSLFNETYVEVTAADIAGINYYHQPHNPPYYQAALGSIPDLLLRESVTEKLQAANKRLQAVGLELYCFDCYRPQSVQRFFYEKWVLDWLAKAGLQGEKKQSHRNLFWSKPAPSDSEVNQSAPPPHSTGAAVDLTIRIVSTGQPLYMGSMFDDVCEMSFTDFFERTSPYPTGSFSEDEARKNRRLLYWIMTEAGFANYPGEWWHFSWGDQMWAKLSGNTTAHYSQMVLS